jgi:hypothetical protein
LFQPGVVASLGFGRQRLRVQPILAAIEVTAAQREECSPA